jgi:hypothetical protein
MRYLLILLISFSACRSDLDSRFQHWQQVLSEQGLNGQKQLPNLLASLKQQVRREGNTTEGKDRIRRGEMLLSAADSLLIDLENLKSEIRQTEASQLNELLLGKQKTGKAYQIQQKIDAFSQWILKNYEDVGASEADFGKLFNQPIIDSIFKNTMLEKRNFAEFYFKDHSPIQAMTQIDVFKNFVIYRSQEVLKKLGAWAGYHAISCCFSAFPTILAKADTITEGADYEAVVFYNFCDKFKTFEFHFPNNLAKKSEYDMHYVKFRPEKQGKQIWQAQIDHYNSGTAQDTSFSISQEYFVIPQ